MNTNQYELDCAVQSSETIAGVVPRMRFSDREVVFVDDNDKWLKIMERWFKDTAYKCHFVHSAPAALEILAKRDIDLVVSDQSMPVMTGSQLMKEIQTRYPDIRRVIMSGKFDVMSTIDAINDGKVHHYVVKPCESKEIKLVVYDSLNVLEKKEKQQTRDIEIRSAAVARIKSMGKSIQRMNTGAEKTHQGIIQLIRNLVIPTPERQAEASRFIATLKKICECLDFDAEPAQQLELAATFLQLAFNPSCDIQITEDGQVKFDALLTDHVELTVHSSDILVKLGSPIASQVVNQFVAFHCDRNLTLNDDRVDVSCALLQLAHDLHVLNDEFKFDMPTAFNLLEPHAQRYGTEIFYEALMSFTSETLDEAASA